MAEWKPFSKIKEALTKAGSQLRKTLDLEDDRKNRPKSPLDRMTWRKASERLAKRLQESLDVKHVGTTATTGLFGGVKEKVDGHEFTSDLTSQGSADDLKIVQGIVSEVSDILKYPITKDKIERALQSVNRNRAMTDEEAFRKFLKK